MLGLNLVMNNIIQSYQEAYQENKNQFAQLSSEELLAFRKRALDLSEEVSWPNRKNENWKYAPLKALQEKKVSLDLEKKIRLMNVHSLVKKQKITDISDYPQLKKYFIPDSQDSIFTLFNHTLWQEACLFHIVNTQKTNEIVHLRLSSLSAENAEFIKLLSLSRIGFSFWVFRMLLLFFCWLFFLFFFFGLFASRETLFSPVPLVKELLFSGLRLPGLSAVEAEEF